MKQYDSIKDTTWYTEYCNTFNYGFTILYKKKKI